MKNTQSVEPNIADYDIMETLISAIQKLVIKDVVLYAKRKEEGMREVLNVW